MGAMDQAISTDTTTIGPREGAAMPLEKELAVYDANLIDLLANEGSIF